MTYPNSRHVSAHLSWAELACKDGTPYPEGWKTSRAVKLASVFEAIRAACGNLPITVTSAYRTPAHNAKIGGARASQHVQGRALDLRPPKGWTVARFHRRIRELAAERPELRGIGIYRTFVHVDIRPSVRLVAWNGGGAVKDDAQAARV